MSHDHGNFDSSNLSYLQNVLKKQPNACRTTRSEVSRSRDERSCSRINSKRIMQCVTKNNLYLKNYTTYLILTNCLWKCFFILIFFFYLNTFCIFHPFEKLEGHVSCKTLENHISPTIGSNKKVIFKHLNHFWRLIYIDNPIR